MPLDNNGNGNEFVFENVEQANFRLANSLIEYENKLYWVNEIRDGFADGIPRIYMWNPMDENRKTVRKQLNSPRFNRFRPFQMGFLNYFEDGAKNCMFTSRQTARRNRQGLTKDTFAAHTVDGQQKNLDLRICSGRESFAEMVNGIYPSFDEAVDALTPNSAVAFDRNYAVRMDPTGLVTLYRKKERIGLIRKDTKEVYLFQLKQYYREEMATIRTLPRNINNW